MTSASTCNVCCETINKSNRKLNKCIECKYEVCSECNIKFILSIKNYAECMNCKIKISYESMNNFFTKKFINGEYANHTNQMLIEKDISRLPEDQPAAEKKIKKIKIVATISKLINERAELNKYIISCDNRGYYPSKFIDINIKISEIDSEIDKLNQDLNILYEENDKNTKSIKYVRKCIAKSCMGFLNDTFECGICNIKVCKDCNEISSTNHICDKDTLATIKLINLNSKQCPKVGCDYTIYKIDGCDQMFCTKCHTAWDWQTGKIETKRLHNPHYYEYVRQMNNGEIPREQGDNECGDILPNLIHLIQKMNSLNIPKETQRIISHIHRMYVHIEMVTIEKWNNYSDNYEENARNNRISFLINGAIFEKTYKSRIIQFEIDKLIGIEVAEVYRSFLLILKDKFQDIMICKNESEFNSINDSFDEIKIYINEIIQGISKKFNNKSIDIINESSDPAREWTLTTTGRLYRKRKLNMEKMEETDISDDSD